MAGHYDLAGAITDPDKAKKVFEKLQAWVDTHPLNNLDLGMDEKSEIIAMWVLCSIFFKHLDEMQGTVANAEAIQKVFTDRDPMDGQVWRTLAAIANEWNDDVSYQDSKIIGPKIASEDQVALTKKTLDIIDGIDTALADNGCLLPDEDEEPW